MYVVFLNLVHSYHQKAQHKQYDLLTVNKSNSPIALSRGCDAVKRVLEFDRILEELDQYVNVMSKIGIYCPENWIQKTVKVQQDLMSRTWY